MGRQGGYAVEVDQVATRLGQVAARDVEVVDVAEDVGGEVGHRGRISPYTIILVAALVAFGIVVGRMRRESRYVIALNTVGVVLFFVGMAWASSLGQEAFGAMAVATLGAILFTMGSERSRVARSAR